MLEKQNKFTWNTNLETIFNNIKSTIMNTEMVYHPDPNKPFSVYCDASIDGVGAVLTQVHDGQLRPISFCSKLFNRTQQNWHVSEQEIYAVIHAVEKWRSYLIGNHFTVYTDHLNLQELFNRAKNFRAGKLYRWAVRLQEFDFTAKYISGKNNKAADYMSRDALKSQHSTNQTTTKQSTKPKPIYQLYLQHLITTSNNPYFSFSDHIIYTMDPDEVDSGSEDDEDEDNEPINIPSPNISPDTPQISIPNTLHKPPTSSSKSISKHIPHPIYKAPKHKYNTRFAKKQRTNIQFQQNLQKKLIHIPDLEHVTPFKLNHVPEDDHNTAPYTPTEQTNHNIIQNKYSYPAANQILLQPNNPSIPTLHETYDIDSYVQTIPIQNIIYHQTMDPSLYPIIQYLINHNNYYLNDLPNYQYRYVLSGRYYINHQNILMYQYGPTNAIVLPSNLRRSALQWAHEQVHHGGGKMYLRLTKQAKYWWIGIRKDIQAYHPYAMDVNDCRRGGIRIQKWIK